MFHQSPATESNSENRQATIAHLAELIADVPVAMLTTCRPDHTLHSRPMVNVNSAFQGELWFFSHECDPKNEEVRGNPQVNVTFAEPAENKYVSIAGSGSIIHDDKRNELLWSESCAAWFPKGPVQSNLVLIRVEMQCAEFWDADSNAMIAVGQELASSDDPNGHESIAWDAPGSPGGHG